SSRAFRQRSGFVRRLRDARARGDRGWKLVAIRARAGNAAAVAFGVSAENHRRTLGIGAWPSGKAQVFGTCIRRFESFRPSFGLPSVAGAQAIHGRATIVI